MTEPNRLFFGDNLEILQNRNYFPNDFVDLIYLDPPFNSNRDYNVLFKEESGVKTESQIVAFKDTWDWSQETQDTYESLVLHSPDKLSKTLESLSVILGNSPMMAYLVMMAARLAELHRVLKPTGSLYLHCDPTASHYLKILLDSVFGATNFRNEIVWKRTSAHNDRHRSRLLGRIHDIIFFYTKSNTWTWNTPYRDYTDDYIEKSYRHIEEDTDRRFKTSDLSAAKPGGTYEWKGQTPPVGRYWAYSLENMQKLEEEGRIYYSRTGLPYLKQYLDEMPGVKGQSIWDDIPPISGSSKEKLGYPTQKPVKLLERILQMSSNEGDVILDPFCGCGTAISAAQNLKRQWIGIDIAALSVAVIKIRLFDEFDISAKQDYEVHGEPVTSDDARHLALYDRYQFQWWALSLINARPIGEGVIGTGKGKKGKDRGIDGVINFFDGKDNARKRHSVIVQVKSGKVKSGDIRDLGGVLEREQAPIGVFISLENPSKEMTLEAISAGKYQSPLYGTSHPRLQILTIEQLMAGAKVDMPPQHGTFTRAERMKLNEADQLDLF